MQHVGKIYFVFSPRVQKDCLAFSPLLPNDISELCIRGVNYLGNQMDWLLRRDEICIILREQASSTSKSYDLQVVLKASGTKIPLTAGNIRAKTFFLFYTRFILCNKYERRAQLNQKTRQTIHYTKHNTCQKNTKYKEEEWGEQYKSSLVPSVLSKEKIMDSDLMRNSSSDMKVTKDRQTFITVIS